MVQVGAVCYLMAHQARLALAMCLGKKSAPVVVCWGSHSLHNMALESQGVLMGPSREQGATAWPGATTDLIDWQHNSCPVGQSS